MEGELFAQALSARCFGWGGLDFMEPWSLLNQLRVLSIGAMVRARFFAPSESW